MMDNATYDYQNLQRIQKIQKIQKHIISLEERRKGIEAWQEQLSHATQSKHQTKTTKSVWNLLNLLNLPQSKEAAASRRRRQLQSSMSTL